MANLKPITGGYQGGPARTPSLLTNLDTSGFNSYGYSPINTPSPSSMPDLYSGSSSYQNLQSMQTPITPTMGFGGAGTGVSAGALVGGPVGAVVGGAIGLGTDIIGMVMQYQAQEEQKRENQRIERINERRYRSDKAEEDRRYKSNKAMAKEEQAYQRGQTELNREERQEQLRYTRAWDFTNRMASLVNRNTNYRDRFRGMRA